MVGLAVLGYAAWTYRDRLPLPIGTSDQAATPPSASSTSASGRPVASQLGVLARIREPGVLRLGMEPDVPPLRFINDRKQDDGFDFRLAGVVAEETSHNLTVLSKEPEASHRPSAEMATELNSSA